MRYLLPVLALLCIAPTASAQDEGGRRAALPRKDGPWFGVMVPPKADAAAAVKVGPRTPRPVSAADSSSAEFAGPAIKSDVETIVGFARAARRSKEIGSGQMWGRVSGFPSSEKTIEWTVDQFRKAGINDVKTQPIAQDEQSALWLPLSWKVTLLGDPAFGAGSSDIVLESA